MAAKFLKKTKTGKIPTLPKMVDRLPKKNWPKFSPEIIEGQKCQILDKKVTMFPKKWLSRSIIGAIREESSWAISPLHIWATCRLLLLLFLLLLLLSVFDLIFVIVVVIVSALHNTTYKGNSGGKQILRTTRKRRNLNWMLMLQMMLLMLVIVK